MSGILNAAVIDVHAHAVLSETMGAAGPYGPTLGAHPDGTPWFQVGTYRLDGVRYAGSPFMDVDIRLAQMDAARIDFQVLSPNPLTHMHFIEPAEAARFCRVHNDALARIVAHHPERLAGLAALPLQDPAAAADELERSIRELKLWGAAIGTDSPRPLHHPELDQLYEKCVALDIPLFIHPGPAGIDGPAGDPMLKMFDLDVVVGFAAQETLAVASLVYGGVLDRHPDLDICLSHGGGSTAYLIGRMARAARKRPWSPQHLRAEGAFESRFARLWLDTHLNSPGSLDLLISVAGRERLVLGTNFAGWDAPDHDDTHTPEPWLADNARLLLRAERHAARAAA